MRNDKERARATARPGVESLEERVVPDGMGAAGLGGAQSLLLVDDLRGILGSQNPNVTGSLGGGRREISWDSGLSGVSASGLLPGDFFNAALDGRARGVVLFNPSGGGFRVSQDGSAGADQLRFGDVNPTYTGAFRAFSPERLFTPLGGNVTEVQFFLPGTTTPATTRGFGVVFTDVDKADSTKVEFFDVRGELLFASTVRASAGDGSQSFLGVSYKYSPIAKVRITSGEGPLGPNDVTQGGAQDLVVMDDLVFGEPVAFGLFGPGSAQGTVEGQPLTFGSAGGNALGVNFRGLAGGAEGGSSPVRVRLRVTNGTLSLSGTAGLIFLAGDGSEDRTLTFTGTVADVNAALDGLVYTPDPGFLGSDQVLVEALDSARTGTVPIEVGPNTLRDGPGVFDPATVTWHQRHETTAGFSDAPPFAFGFPAWKPVAGDWDGDGQDTIGVADTTGATGPFAVWYLHNANGVGAPDGGPFAYGVAGWVPVVGDWDGDGVDTIGMFDPATGTWYLRNSNDAGAPDAGQFAYGLGNWLPVVGDWDGNGADGIGIIDPTGVSDFVTGRGGVWYLRNSPSNGAPDLPVFPYGNAGWLPLTGHWGSSEALHATGEGRGAAALTPGELEAMVSAAGFRLSAAGVDPNVVRLLARTRFEVANLPGDLLGLAEGGRVLIDQDAAGNGWFVDATPRADEEFADGVALPGGEAEGRVDLLSAVLHELGHLAGLRDVDGGGLMGGELGVGTRRADALDAVFSGA
jgi:hypothetical protein